jgi:HEAT repeat protein
VPARKLSESAIRVAKQLLVVGDKEVKLEVCQLTKSLVAEGNNQAIGILEILIRENDFELRKEAVDLLVYLGKENSGEAVAALKNALRHGNPTVRAAVIYALAELNTLTVVDIKYLLEDRDGFVREAAVYTVGKSGRGFVQELAADLEERLQDRVAEVRVMTVKVITQFGNTTRKNRANLSASVDKSAQVRSVSLLEE